jgi:hypothetical protein
MKEDEPADDETLGLGTCQSKLEALFCPCAGPRAIIIAKETRMGSNFGHSLWHQLSQGSISTTSTCLVDLVRPSLHSTAIISTVGNEF